MNFRFLITMAWRDSRRSRRKLALYGSSVVLGVAAVVAVGSFSANLNRAMDDQAKTLLGADLAVFSRQPFTPEAEGFLQELGGEISKETNFSSMVVFPDHGGQTRLVQVRAIEGRFPFYGEFVTAPADRASRLWEGPYVLLEETLMIQFGLQPGDPLMLGRKAFTLAGALISVPGDSPAVAMLAPRIYVALGEIEGTGLLGPASLARYKRYLKFSEETDVEALVREMRGRFRSLRLGFDTVEERRRDLGSAMENIAAFMRLTGLIALLLGAIGVAGAMHLYAGQKRATVALLRCLGAPQRVAFGVFLLQAGALGVFGALAGSMVGLGVQKALPVFFAGLLPVSIEFSIAWPPLLQGMFTGMVIAVLFAWLPLLEIRRASPLLALRSAYEEARPKADVWRWILWIALAGAITGFSVALAGRWKWGIGFAAALGVAFVVLTGAARALMLLSRKLRLRRTPYVWRQGVANLHRPENRTMQVLFAVGLATFLMLTLYSARGILLGQLGRSIEGDRPNLALFDIQDDQTAGIEGMLHDLGAPGIETVPIVTMRIASINGRSARELLRAPDVSIPGWTLRREYRSTYRGELTETEEVVAGLWQPQVEPGEEPVPISIEQKLASDLGIGLGDEIVFDVQGVPVSTKIASLRKVEWQRLRPNFFVVFPEGVLEGAPKFHVIVARAATPEESARIQQSVVASFPNVSAIDLTRLMEALDRIFSRASAGVRFLALFTVVTGILVVAVALWSTRAHRIRESVLLRTLGATRAQILRILLAEYVVLGALAALLGAGLAALANRALAAYVFKTSPAELGFAPAFAVLAVTVLIAAVGALSSRGIATHPPLEVLRQEN